MAVGKASICEYPADELPSQAGCTDDTSWNVKASERSLWQVLLDFFGLQFERGEVFRAPGQ
jgi:hypothetical protein